MVQIIDLVEKAKRGNEKAFLTLFTTYEEEIYRMAFIYVKNQNDALDVVQETAYRSFKSISKLKEPNYFKSWLIKIAINCSLDYLRKQNRYIQLNPNFEDTISIEVEEDIDLEITIKDLIEGLDEDEKSVIILRFYQDLTIKEVSETLKIPLGTVKTILYRTLKKLSGKLKGDDVYE